MKRGDFRLKEQANGFKRLMRILPVILGNEAENHFKEGFRTGGGQTDASAGGWKPRKRETRLTRGKGILVGRGDLMRDIKRRKTSYGRAIVSTQDTIYANIHNEGLTGKAFGKHPFKMPKREFMGKSKKLETKMNEIIVKELRKL